jgi:hypothetical protein
VLVGFGLGCDLWTLCWTFFGFGSCFLVVAAAAWVLVVGVVVEWEALVPPQPATANAATTLIGTTRLKDPPSFQSLQTVF